MEDMVSKKDILSLAEYTESQRKIIIAPQPHTDIHRHSLGREITDRGRNHRRQNPRSLRTLAKRNKISVISADSSEAGER